MCLFALDKNEAIPVDTHVWQLATRYYLPGLKGMLCASFQAGLHNSMGKLGPWRGCWPCGLPQRPCMPQPMEHA